MKRETPTAGSPVVAEATRRRTSAGVIIAEPIVMRHSESTVSALKRDGVMTERGSTGSFLIRRAHPSDAGALSGFAARLFRATYSSDTAAADLDSYISQNFTTEKQAAEIVDPSAAVFLATSDDSVIGYAHVTAGAADIGMAHLNRIYIDAEWRGSGLADDLLETAADECRQRGFKRMELTVFDRNVRAIAFYKRAGFTATGSTIFMVGEDLQTDVVMELDLVV